MFHVIALVSVFVRLFRPSAGVHAEVGYFRSMWVETRRRRRASRVRRFVLEAGHVVSEPPAPRGRVFVSSTLPPPVMAHARVPADYWPVVNPVNVARPAAMVRGPYRAWERARAEHAAA